ncbi:hypothetical protein PCANC_09693 [Puccinia coronata f. sp. avenae]|uniref:Uncharacterized protein n=1 Tax=Puccinia coronata f. sp. avenae TaxID=200324 RepID=A0A2N5VAR6_9BASI|nr:hypothetical protein PCANC_09693 [Puccinia coronata f. sp. avenae]
MTVGFVIPTSVWNLDRSKQREGENTSDSASPTNQPCSNREISTYAQLHGAAVIN